MRTEQKDETFQSLLEPNILTDKIVAVSKLFRILSWWCWLESKQTASQSTKKDLLDNDWVNWLSYLEEPYPDADPADDSANGTANTHSASVPECAQYAYGLRK